jgi:hypothetical protein
MLQRIQTIYFFIAFVISMLFMFVPLASIGDELIVLSDSVLLKGEVLATNHLPVWLYIGIPCICSFFIVMCFVTYKNRPVQMKLSAASLLLSAVWAVLSFIQLDKIRLHEMPEGQISYSFGSYIPVIVIAFLILGLRGVKKDEDLVRSVDRLR